MKSVKLVLRHNFGAIPKYNHCTPKIITRILKAIL